jgi:lysophospholipid acyltransferase (LPLAT)-like uncharacterized protein
VTRKNEKVFAPSPLDVYTFWQRVVIVLADWAFFILINVIGLTTRLEVSGQENLQQIEANGEIPIYATWHDRIFLGTYFLRNRGIVFLTSRSFDGEYIARFLLRFGFGVIRGSSTRGGARALVEMVREMKRGLPMGFTIDGPKGPRYLVKSGAAMLARKTSNPILPFIVTPKRFFTINSWDRLQIPMPFTRVHATYGTPIRISNEGSEAVEKGTRQLQEQMNALVENEEKWRSG